MTYVKQMEAKKQGSSRSLSSLGWGGGGQDVTACIQEVLVLLSVFNHRFFFRVCGRLKPKLLLWINLF